MQPQPFSSPRVGSGEPGPATSELAGRLVAFVVKGYDPNAEYEGTKRPNVTADIYVIDGGPLEYGGNYSLTKQQDNRPPYLVTQTPCVFRDRFVSGDNLVRALASEVGKGPVLGIVVRSTVGRRPWNLDKVPDGDPRWQYASQFWAAMMSGQWSNPEPQNIPGRVGPVGVTPPPAPGAPVPNPYAQVPQAPPQQYGQPATQQYGAPPQLPYGTPPSGNPNQYGPAPTNADEARAAQAQQPQAPYLTQFQPNGYMTQPAAQQWQQSQAMPQLNTQVPPTPGGFPQPQMQSAGATYADGQSMPPAPQGYEQIWPTMTREQHAAVLAQAQPSTYGQGAPQQRPNMY